MWSPLADFFGAAPGANVYSSHAYHNQPNNEGNSRGHLSVNRWHINPVTATNASNYALNNGSTVLGARMGAGADTVLLRSSSLSAAQTNVLTVNGVTDLAPVANTLLPNSTIVVEQKLQTWLRLDEGPGQEAAFLGQSPAW